MRRKAMSYIPLMHVVIRQFISADVKETFCKASLESRTKTIW
jgi:hypothetical protein